MALVVVGGGATATGALASGAPASGAVGTAQAVGVVNGLPVLVRVTGP